MIEYKKIIDKRLIELFNKKDLPYQILIDAALYAVDTTAKRIRPLLILSCVKSYDQDISIAIDPACAIELVHTYSLIHDDLPCMDDDDFRRGKPTLHKKYPEWVAVLTGDYLLSYAFEIVLNIKNLSEKQILELARTLSKNSCNLLAGQTVDLVSENKKIDFETLNFMHLNKTASLFVAAIDFAAIILNLDSKKRENLNIFAKKLGFIFQIQDDILGAFADEKKLGKSTLSDMREGKNIILIYKAKELVTKGDLVVLEKLWGLQSAKISDLKKVREIVKKCGVLFWCEKEKRRLSEKAKGHIKNVTADLYYQGILEEVVDFAGNRQN